jgi:sugar phosphate isomerase/epimerase
MKYAICNETFQDRSLAEGCEAAVNCGYTGLEVAPFTLAGLATDITAAQREEIRKTITSAGLEPIGLHWLLAKTEGFHATTGDAEMRKRTAAYLGDLARLSADLGGKVLVFGSPQQRSLQEGVTLAEAHDHFVEVLTAALPVLEQTGCVVAIEPLSTQETDVITTAAEACTLIDRIDSPHVRLHLDVKAMSSEAEPIADVIRANAKHLEHFHANDANLQGPGFGEVEYAPIFQALRDVAYDGWVSVEVFDYAPGPDRLAKDSIDYMRRVEAELG